MSKSCVIVLPFFDEIPDNIQYLVGADRGAFLLAKRGIHMDLAIGDFDSVSDDEFQLIKSHCDEFIRLNPIKDDSDSEACVVEMLSRGYNDIRIVGAFGGRVDHSLVNIMLAEKYPQIVTVTNSQNRVCSYREGTYHIKKEEYHFVSFFAVTDSVISLEGMKYPLDKRLFYPADMYGLSNEILSSEGILTVHQGHVLMIQSKD